ncbi:DNA methyltransferase [Sphingomonas sp. Leaf257]|nr:DNA methyltransferase [Sphingomonas sp. Leaf257]
MSSISTPAPYLGGKRNLAKRLTALIGATPHRIYVEPFVGMGGIFLRRSRPAPVEVINDISGDVINFFRVAQRHPDALAQDLRGRLSSREEFERLRRVDPTTLTDIERAGRFLYLQRLTFGGKIRTRTFGVDKTGSSRFDPRKVIPNLERLGSRLAGVTIERLGYAAVIERYDDPRALFYLDPPYWDCEDDYGTGVFERADFERLADQLATIRGRFILSINATDGARAVFSRFDIEDVETTYTVGSGSGKRVRELIISNISNRKD